MSFDLEVNISRLVVIVAFIICVNMLNLTVADDPKIKRMTFSQKLDGAVKLFSIDCVSVQYGMWARSVKLAIRKLKCWVNAIPPIMFIKEMNKLV